jgi:hypothetical protein
VGHVVHCGTSGAQNIDALFFLLGWDRYRFQKKRVETRYSKLVFLHLVGYADHVVHSSVSGVQNIDTLYFMLVWDRYRFQKERDGTRYIKLVFLDPVEYCGSRSALWCVRDAKRRRTIFLAWVGQVQIPQKWVRIPYAELMFLHPVVFAGHIVNPCAYGVQNVGALFFVLEWDWCGFNKKLVRISYVELVFLHPVGYVGHVVRSGASGRETSIHYFSWSCGTDTYSRKCASGHVTPNLCFCIRWDPAGHMVHCGASRTRNVDAQLFLLGCHRYGSHKNTSAHLTPNLCFASCAICGSCSAFLCL